MAVPGVAFGKATAEGKEDGDKGKGKGNKGSIFKDVNVNYALVLERLEYRYLREITSNKYHGRANE